MRYIINKLLVWDSKILCREEFHIPGGICLDGKTSRGIMFGGDNVRTPSAYYINRPMTPNKAYIIKKRDYKNTKDETNTVYEYSTVSLSTRLHWVFIYAQIERWVLRCHLKVAREEMPRIDHARLFHNTSFKCDSNTFIDNKLKQWFSYKPYNTSFKCDLNTFIRF